MENRVIKFRGYSYEKQSWLYGNLIEKDNPQIAEPTPWVRLIHNRVLDASMVVFESVGQYTGLKDKNGVEIYEHDVIDSANLTMYGGKYEIIWHEQICAWVGHIKNVKPILLYDFVLPGVLGNTLQHPHLLNQQS